MRLIDAELQARSLYKLAERTQPDAIFAMSWRPQVAMTEWP